MIREFIQSITKEVYQRSDEVGVNLDTQSILLEARELYRQYLTAARKERTFTDTSKLHGVDEAIHAIDETVEALKKKYALQPGSILIQQIYDTLNPELSSVAAAEKHIRNNSIRSKIQTIQP